MAVGRPHARPVGRRGLARRGGALRHVSPEFRGRKGPEKLPGVNSCPGSAAGQKAVRDGAVLQTGRSADCEEGYASRELPPAAAGNARENPAPVRKEMYAWLPSFGRTRTARATAPPWTPGNAGPAVPQCRPLAGGDIGGTSSVGHFSRARAAGGRWLAPLPLDPPWLREQCRPERGCACANASPRGETCFGSNHASRRNRSRRAQWLINRATLTPWTDHMIEPCPPPGVCYNGAARENWPLAFGRGDGALARRGREDGGTVG
jgi:hypothetical protein